MKDTRLSRFTVQVALLVLLSLELCLCFKGTVYYNAANNSYSFSGGAIDRSGVAFGSFDDYIAQDGIRAPCFGFDV